MHFRTIHGYRRAFLHEGRGPVILLIHGIGDSSITWGPILPGLARDHTVIAPDLLGHGASDKPRADYSVSAYANAMRDLLSVLGVDRATVVGHSFGGGVVMQMAYQYPERCERLILVSPGGVARQVNPLLRAASAPNVDLLLPMIGLLPVRIAVRVALDVLSRMQTNFGRDAEHFLRVFDALPNAATRRAFVRTLRSVIDWRGQVVTMLDRAYLTEGTPTLLVWGAKDPIIPHEHAVKLQAAMPWSRLVTFDQAGHFPHRTDPARFLSVLRDFMSTTAPGHYDVEAWRARLRRGRLDGLPPDATPSAEDAAAPLPSTSRRA
jgi:pimeloyl-ACP methyl ester carboxylesterase